MSIEFRCPNGHRLSCPDDRAGLSGNCPKCKATFRVPNPGDPPPAASDSGIGVPELTDAPAEEQPAPGAHHETTDPVLTDTLAEQPAAGGDAPPEDRIVFLCPNGHKLNCPASMRGRPGRCPHCAATFLVPEYEPDEGEEFSESLDEPARETAVFNGETYEAGSFPFDFAALTSETSPESTSAHAMANVFQRLWIHKRTGAVVDLYLKGGEVIAPEWYASRLSQEAYGMFAFPEADGSFTMTAIHWDAIERIAVRGVSSLPQGMFDEE